MNINLILEDLGWGKYQDILYANCMSSIFLNTLWMEMTSLLMQEYTGEPWEIFMLPIALNLGSVLGCIIQSYLIGELGRASVFTTSAMISTIGGFLLCVFPYTFIIHIGVFIVGYGTGGDMVVAYTILMESIPQSRISSLTLLNIGWSIGTALFVFMTLGFEIIPISENSGWLMLGWLGTISSGFSAYFRNLLVESPMFLYDRGDLRLGKTLKKIASINKRQTYEVCKTLLVKQEEEVVASSFFDKEILYGTILLSLEYLLTSFPYYSLIFFMPEILALSNDKLLYTTILFQQLSGIPGTFLAAHFTNYDPIGRYTRFSGFFLSAIFVLLLLFDLPAFLYSIITCFIFSFMLFGQSALYTCSQEFYPTDLRGIGNGLLCSVSLISGVIGPVIITSIQEKYGIRGDLYVLAASFFFASICALLFKVDH